MKTILRSLLSGVALLAIAGLIGAIVLYSGAYNVSVQSGHSKLIGDALATALRRSVQAHARDITVPASLNLNDPAIAERAISGYEAMCRTCHGAPGRKPEPWEFYPSAPDLTTSMRERGWTDAEIFWIIKHGIKDTAMSAFSGTHTDEDLWAQTALVRQMQTMTADQYRAMAERAGVTLAPPREHDHGPQQSDGHSDHSHKH
jgi:cytochrome c553